MNGTACFLCGKASKQEFCSKACELGWKNVDKERNKNRCSDRVVMAIPDIHAPFHDVDCLDFISDVIRDFRPDRIVCLGDEVDFHACSNYAKDPDGFSAGHELKAAKVFLKDFQKVVPVMDIVTSNHTSRPFRQGFAAGIPSAFMRSYKEAFEVEDGWMWHEDILIDGVLYIHGEGFSGVNAHRTAAEKHMVSVVLGHIHAHAGVQYINNKGGQIFGMNAGWLGDESKYAFRYGKNMPQRPVSGSGIIIGGGKACFIPKESLSQRQKEPRL
jgi:hypothetical protein